MKTLFFGTSGKLRNGWWILIFIAFVALTSLAYTPIVRGLKGAGVAPGWLEPAPFLFSLLATWACTRLRKESLSSVGYVLNRRWFAEFAAGTAISTCMIVLITTAIWAIGGVRFESSPTFSLWAIGYGLYMFTFVALFEENLLRGFLFQRMVDGSGVWIAQITLAALFALGHWDNPGMEGATKFWASADLFAGAILLGLAYLRTRSLALPIGLHLGWNFTQGYVFGFGVSGMEQSGWLQPVFLGQAEWLTGGNFGPEASAFAVVVDLIAIGLLWRWKGLDKARPVVGSAQAAVVHAA